MVTYIQLTVANCRDVSSPATSCEESQALPVILQTAKGIHAQVLQAEEGLSPGAVLMLQQVALTAVSTSSSTPFVPLSGWLSLNERGQVAPSAFPLLTFDVACQVPLLVLSKTLKYLCITVENIVQVINCN
ncbi:TPA: hypothetical protein ACH3X2_001556 [Trebouxia sp. C0005]